MRAWVPAFAGMTPFLIDFRSIIPPRSYPSTSLPPILTVPAEFRAEFPENCTVGASNAARFICSASSLAAHAGYFLLLQYKRRRYKPFRL
jgi:hypothetical protein